MYLVVYTLKGDPRVSPDTDHYVACATMPEAENEYQVLINQDNVYCASICGVIKSTDYDHS